MTDMEGLVFACRLDGKGGGTFGGWDLVEAGGSTEMPLWIHLDFRSEAGHVWLATESGLPKLSSAALLAEATRPRSVERDGSILLDLRGVNLNPGARPDDMISLRAHISEARIITTRHRHLMAIEDIKSAIQEGTGPSNAGDFVCALTDQLLMRMSSSLESVEHEIDALHDRIMDTPGPQLRSEVARLRNQVIELRRYLAPQREAVARLQTAKAEWLTEIHRERLRELADRTTRHVEDLDAARERAGVAQEELAGRISEQMNRTMYLLALVSMLFLPLGLITGLLGVNVGGLPGSDDPLAFWILCGIMLGMALLMWRFFKRRQWL